MGIAKLLLFLAIIEASAGIEVDRVEGTTIHFRATEGAAPKPLEIELFDLKELGFLPALEEGDLPWFWFAARPCQDCLQDLGIYAIRPAPGKPDAYVYPGKIIEPKSGNVVLESRAFIGRCLYSRKEPVYVVFQKERVDRRRGLQSSVLVVEAGKDHLEEKLIERRLPRVQDTLKLVKAKKCREIEGRNRRMLSKSIDARSRHAREDDSEDDDSPPKENQTDRDLKPQAP